MLDVHMPHATHTWKDFFIHIATITVGLLIAVSLEQTVEWVHHLHQRHQLEADLRAEAARNHDNAEIDIAIYDNVVKWLLQLQSAGRRCTDGQSQSAFRLPRSPRRDSGLRADSGLPRSLDGILDYGEGELSSGLAAAR